MRRLCSLTCESFGTKHPCLCCAAACCKMRGATVCRCVSSNMCQSTVHNTAQITQHMRQHPSIPCNARRWPPTALKPSDNTWCNNNNHHCRQIQVHGTWKITAYTWHFMSTLAMHDLSALMQRSTWTCSSLAWPKLLRLTPPDLSSCSNTDTVCRCSHQGDQCAATTGCSNHHPQRSTRPPGLVQVPSASTAITPPPACLF